jgi:hypothetical protein
MRFLSRTPVRTFFIYPVLIFAWQLIRNRGSTSSRCSCRSWHVLPAVPGSVVFIASNMVAAVQVSNPAEPPHLNRTLRLQPQSDISRSSDLSSRIEFDITLLVRRCDHDRGCIVVSPSSHRR